MNDLGRKLIAALEGIADRLQPFTLGEFIGDGNTWYDDSTLAINGNLRGKEFGLAFIQEGLRIVEHQPGDYVAKCKAFPYVLGVQCVEKLHAVRYQGATLFPEKPKVGDIAVTRLGHACIVTGEEYIAARGMRSFRVIEAITGPNGERQGSTIRSHVRRAQDVRYFVALCGGARP